MNRYLITSALPYANGYLHLGHCAGAYLPADIFVRYLRLKGENVLWVCGSDEHGVAITIAAEKEKVTPQQIIDKYHYANKESFAQFGMSFDIYSRTSLELHHETAREFFEDFLRKGYLIEREEEQFYDEYAKMFLPDRYVEGTCPNCNYDKARGDQCDNCGAYYNQLELKYPISLVSGKPPVAKKTIHWYMQFNQFQKFLEDYIESKSSYWKENVLQQSRSWLKQGISERPITRDLNWGIKLDGIDDLPAEKTAGKVLYVWFEAVLGYISATKHYFQDKNPDEWRKWWQAPETKYIAFIGKDNIVFHTLIFPVLLYAKNEGYILPDNVPANEFLNLEGQKFSKSRNWSIDLKDFLRDFPDYVDSLRYTLAMNLPETRDSDFTWKDFQNRNNNELANILGNFINRTLQFIHKNFEGKVPELDEKYKKLPEVWNDIVHQNINELSVTSDLLNENDIQLLISLKNSFENIEKNYSNFRFRDAITETMNIARAANKYFNDEEPWRTLKSDKAKCAKSLFISAQLIRTLSIVFAPIIPFTSSKINKILSIPDYTGGTDSYAPNKNIWNTALEFTLAEGHSLQAPTILFSRIEDKTIEEQVKKLFDGLSTENNLIKIEEFAKIKLKTAKVIKAEKLPKAKKLLKLQIEIEGAKRQILAGIAEHYEPEELVGKTIVVVANLKPTKLMGELSEGMLLAANAPNGKLALIVPDKPDIESGADVR